MQLSDILRGEESIMPLLALPGISESERLRLHTLAIQSRSPVAFAVPPPLPKIRSSARTRQEAARQKENPWSL